jgi:hypothetical protein
MVKGEFKMDIGEVAGVVALLGLACLDAAIWVVTSWSLSEKLAAQGVVLLFAAFIIAISLANFEGS